MRKIKKLSSIICNSDTTALIIAIITTGSSFSTKRVYLYIEY